MNNEIKCPKCDNLIRLDQANFCGMCGANIMNIKQQHYQQQIPQQMYQHYNQPPYPNNGSRVGNETSTTVKVLNFISKSLFFVLISMIVYISAIHLNDFLLDNVIDHGIDPSLFYSYFSGDVVEDDLYYFAGGVSAQEYNKLKTGMSYALTSSIIGGDGDLVNTGENVHNKFYYTYRWYSEVDEDLVYYITFVDDEISEIMLDQN